MDIISVLQLLGGVGLFLYGMSLMTASLENLAGSGLKTVLEKLTTSRKKRIGQIKGWTFGIGVTAIIQSSAAVTIMLSGFVNAGIMKLEQALPVVFGSNVGSTVTAQILRLGDLGSDTLIMRLLKPSSFASILLAVGAFMFIFIKKKKTKDVASILVGLGMLFFGMTVMEQIFEPLRESEKFQSFFTSFKNPFLGLLVGLIITAIIQSSNAAVGILQALSATGTITYAITVPIVIGINIGKCMPIVLGLIGSNKKAKKVSVSYLFFNIFGAALFMLLIYAFYYTIGIAGFDNVVNRGNIANVHLAFNTLTSIVLLIFNDKVADICNKLVGDDDTAEQDKELAKLDDMLLNTPNVALEQCRELIMKMGEAILDNYKMASKMIYEYDITKFPKMEENESFIDKCETALSSYVVRIDRRRLTHGDKLVVSEILNSISDFERMGDYCMNIAYVAQDKNEKNIHFSPYGHREVDTIVSAVEYTMETTFSAFINDDVALAERVEPLSETIDNLKEVIKSHHDERLQAEECRIEGGMTLFDLINSCERIASHAANISLHIIKRVNDDSNFDEMHGHAHDIFSEEYKALYHYYESMYIEPIQRPLTNEELAELLADREKRDAAHKLTMNFVQNKDKADDKKDSNEKKASDKQDKSSDKPDEKKNSKKESKKNDNKDSSKKEQTPIVKPQSKKNNTNNKSSRKKRKNNKKK
ncbi:MAG: Na/Pi cotransporter family protein [Lachnospiraceae bacterium]|nr:Na/Pi cotransporter family protein [Lachnospiraceae bacterium]